MSRGMEAICPGGWRLYVQGAGSYMSRGLVAICPGGWRQYVRGLVAICPGGNWHISVIVFIWRGGGGGGGVDICTDRSNINIGLTQFDL